jgi:glycosyltransferase involved in cell wall biosynthesis
VFDHTRYDGIVVFYHKALRDPRLLGTPLPGDKLAVCINNEKWVGDGALVTMERYFAEVPLVVACNQFIVDQFVALHPRVLRASQVVDPEVFFTDRDNIVRPTRLGPEFVVGWSGNFQQPVKNIDHVKQACERAGVKLLISKNRARNELNRWYNDLVDCVVCASSVEGGPSMILEAGACTRPVVTTPVGLAREIVRDDDTGLVFPVGDIDALAGHLRRLATDLALRARLATALHAEVVQHWTYRAREHEIRGVLRALTTPRRSD